MDICSWDHNLEYFCFTFLFSQHYFHFLFFLRGFVSREGSRISWILATVNSNVFQPGETHCFSQNRNSMKTIFLLNNFALIWIYGYFLYISLFGCFVIWLWVSLIDKNFQFCHCIFLFIFSFYLVVAPTILWRSTLCWCAHFTQCQTKIKLSSCPAWNKKVWKKEEKHRTHMSSCRTQSIMNRKW